MSNDVLEKVKQLPVDKQEQVEDFVDYLLSKYQIANGRPHEKLSGEALAEKRRHAAGWAKGEIWMADDFNETPEDFKDYI